MSTRRGNDADVQRSALVVEEAFQEYFRCHEIDGDWKPFQKIDMSGDEFLAFKVKCEAEDLSLYAAPGKTMTMDYVVNQGAMFLRNRTHFHLNLTGHVVELLKAKIRGMADMEGLEPLRSLVGQIRTRYSAKVKIETEGVHRNRNLEHVSHRTADARIRLETLEGVLSEIIIEITNPAKRALCPDMGREYVKRMLREDLRCRSCTMYFAINLDDETKLASYTIMVGWWTIRSRPRDDDVPRTHARMHTKFLRNETVFRDSDGQMVPGAVRLLPQNILGRYLVGRAFRRRRRARLRALNTRAITIDHQELFDMLEGVESWEGPLRYHVSTEE
ncbi:hypothetical protein IWX90DRAFT_482437 [Phyllosticta citrichinensis]|uniref:Uncharacterized protein n=1 Tax=Phyllosticta citrichinensis TaxID=1130410 RepID=A0ABR1Y6S1_9PEZI